MSLRGIVLCLAQQAIALAHHTDITRQGLLQGAHWPLDRNFVRCQRNFNATGHDDWILGNSRHIYLVTRQRTALRRQYHWHALCDQSSNPWMWKRWRHPDHSLPWVYRRNPCKYAGRDG